MVEDLGGEGPIRVGQSLQPLSDDALGVARDGVGVDRHAAHMVAVLVAVDHVCHGLVGHPLDGAQDVVPKRRGRVDHDDPFVMDDEHVPVLAVAEPEDAVGDLLHDISGVRDIRAPRVPG
ncbi:hypothetical protein BJY14_007917 [Actinomadura luteofluorescens]|uniref:Uncharacterized protein n=1 Tax=Actinomadura luteofluorescens TaxID=46163 RepID=A0A7Y9EQH8_9ACTN|nr:hypothetical protein [Actinomadura luteofluorescens]NYD51934.1 hypothetical protein [Actinomadura luteofluorescens]